MLFGAKLGELEASCSWESLSYYWLRDWLTSWPIFSPASFVIQVTEAHGTDLKKPWKPLICRSFYRRWGTYKTFFFFFFSDVASSPSTPGKQVHVEKSQKKLYIYIFLLFLNVKNISCRYVVYRSIIFLAWNQRPQRVGYGKVLPMLEWLDIRQEPQTSHNHFSSQLPIFSSWICGTNIFEQTRAILGYCVEQVTPPCCWLLDVQILIARGRVCLAQQQCSRSLVEAVYHRYLGDASTSVRASHWDAPKTHREKLDLKEAHMKHILPI